MVEFCLNIILHFPFYDVDYYNKIFQEFNIQKINLIPLYENIDTDKYLAFFQNHNISINVSKNIQFTGYNSLISHIVRDNKENEMLNLLTDYDQKIEFDNLDECFKTSNEIYIKHFEKNHYYPKLFIFNNNIDLDKSSMAYYSFFPLEKTISKNIISSCVLNDNTLQTKYKNIVNTINDESAKHGLTELCIGNYILKNFIKTIENCNKINNSEKWFVNYLLCVSYFNLNNYKKTLEHANICININPKRIEPIYILSKMYFTNKDIPNALEMLKNIPIDKIEYNTNNYFCEIHIYDFFIHIENILVNKYIKNIPKSIKICELINTYIINDSYYSIINSLLNNMLIQTIPNNIDAGESQLFDGFYKDKRPDNGYKFIIDSDNDIFDTIHYNISENKLYLNDKPLSTDFSHKSFTSFRHEDNRYIITDIYPKLNIKKINNELQLEDYKTYDFKWNNLLFSSKLELYRNIYIGILNHKKTSIYRFLFLNSKTLEPITISNTFKLANNIKILDIIIKNDNLYIISDNMIYKLPISDLYFKFNFPIDYNENILIDIDNNINIDITTKGYTLTKLKYKNYTISNNESKVNVEYDFNSNIVKINHLSYNSVIKDFIFLPNNMSTLDKQYDIHYYNKSTIEPNLIKRIEEENFTVNDIYENSKYLIINNYELENLSLIEISKIIESKTLIISLIDEENMNDISQKKTYSNNQFLNKLYLFNILKNDDYIDFIIDNIVKNDEYEQRSEYMSIDIENIYNNCNIFKHFFELSDTLKRKQRNMEDILTKNDYKSYLLNKISEEVVNTNILEILKYILINKQNVDIFYSVKEIPEIIDKFNIFNDSLYTDCMENLSDLAPISCILYLNNVAESINYREVCDENSLIYCADENLLYYT